MRRKRPPREPRGQLDLAEAERLVRAALEEEADRWDVNRFVLAYGTAHRPVHRPADVAAGERHQPFRNAFRLARERGWAYCEGFTLARGWTDQPSRHAWCVDAAGAVVDPSPLWADPGGPLRDCYLGLAIPLAVAQPHADGGQKTPKGVLYELTGRMEVLAAALGVEPV